MDDQIFSDGIGTITVIGTTVRVDFVSLSPTEREPNGQPKAVFKQRIVLTVDGFLRSAGKVQEAVQALSKIGAGQQQQQASTTLNVPTTLTPRSEERLVETAPVAPAATPEPAPLQRAGAKPPFP